MTDRRAQKPVLAAALAALGWITPGVASAQWPPAGQAAQPDPSASPGAAQPQPAQQPPAYDPSMQAGGLAPPPPIDPNAPKQVSKPPESTEEELDEAKKKDSKRGLSFFW